MKILYKLWNCYLLKNHLWTCAAAEGIQPTKVQLSSGTDGFYDYAKMYCKICGKEILHTRGLDQ